MHGEIEILSISKQARYRIMPGEFIILGRGQTADIVLDNDSAISRLHCKISSEKNQYWVEDLKSRNHTYVNGQKIFPQTIAGKEVFKKALQDGDEIQAGTYKIVFRLIKEKEKEFIPKKQEPFTLLKRSDKLTGKILVKIGVLTYERLRDCIKRQEEIAQSGLYYPLEEVLLQEEFVTEEDLRKVEEFKKNIPFHIPDYKLKQLIGMGGMGRIYEAEDAKGKSYACKVFCEWPEDLEQALKEQFKKEASALMKFNHPNIVRGLAYGESDNILYLVMEYVNGPTLQQYIKDEGDRLLLDKALSIVIHVTKALQHAYELGFIHRDIKPENILLTNQGVAKLCDFGLVKDASSQHQSEENVFGTVAYMSPEQILPDMTTDIRSDIYSLGAVFYRMVFGRLPFVGDSKRIRLQHIKEPVTFPDEGKNFQKLELARVISKMMAKKPEDRYQTPSDLLHELQSLATKFETTEIDVTQEVPNLQNETLILQAKRRIPYGLIWMVGIVALVLCAVVLGWNYYERKRIREAYLTIGTAISDKDYDLAQKNAQYFLRTYPENERCEDVRLQLQQVLLEKAMNAKLKRRLADLSLICQEIEKTQKNSPITLQCQKLLKELQEEILLAQKRAAFEREIARVDTLMDAQQLDEAQNLLDSLKDIRVSPECEEDWKKRQQRLSHTILTKRLAPYHYYPASELKLSVKPPDGQNKTTDKVSISEILLAGSKGALKKGLGLDGYFFLPVKGYLHCLSASNGRVLWSFRLGGKAPFHWKLLMDKKLSEDSAKANKILISQEGSSIVKMVSLEKNSMGTVLWEQNFPSTLSGRLWWHEKNDDAELFIPCEDCYCYQVDVSNGKIKGAFFTETPVRNILTEESVLLLAGEKNIYKFDFALGTLISYVSAPDDLCGCPWANGKHWMFVTQDKRDKGQSTIWIYPKDREIAGFSPTPVQILQVDGKNPTFLGSTLNGLFLLTDQILAFLPILTTPDAKKQIAESKIVRFPKETNCDSWISLSKDQFLTAESVPKIWSFPTSDGNELQNVWEYKPEKKLFPGTPYTPWQKAGDLYFIGTQKETACWGSCFQITASEKKIAWQQRVGSAVTSQPVVISDQILWAATEDGSIMQIDASADLLPKIRIRKGNIYETSRTQIMYLQRGDGQVAIIQENGNSTMLKSDGVSVIEDWRLSQDDITPNLGEGLDNYKNEILFLTQKNKVKAFSCITGRKQSQDFESLDTITTPPVYYKGSVFIGDAQGDCNRLKLFKKSGTMITFQRVWKFNAGSAIRSLTAAGLKGVYIGTEKGILYRIDSNTGEVKWQYATQNAIQAPPLVLEKIVVVANLAGQVSALDMETGKVRWTQQIQGGVRTQILSSNGKVFVATVQGEITAFLETGKKLWNACIPGAIAKLFTLHKSRLYACTEEGFLYTLQEK